MLVLCNAQKDGTYTRGQICYILKVCGFRMYVYMCERVHVDGSEKMECRRVLFRVYGYFSKRDLVWCG